MPGMGSTPQFQKLYFSYSCGRIALLYMLLLTSDGYFMSEWWLHYNATALYCCIYDDDEWASTTTREVFHTGAGFGEAGVVPTSPSSYDIWDRILQLFNWILEFNAIVDAYWLYKREFWWDNKLKLYIISKKKYLCCWPSPYSREVIYKRHWT